MKEMNVKNIEELAEKAQSHCYNSEAHPIQLAETKQFYMMGFFEGMQMGNAMPQNIFQKAFKEVSKSIQNRIAELMKNKQ